MIPHKRYAFWVVNKYLVCVGLGGFGGEAGEGRTRPYKVPESNDSEKVKMVGAGNEAMGMCFLKIFLLIHLMPSIRTLQTSYLS